MNFGHNDAYSSALTYRALNCLADLERLANRPVFLPRGLIGAGIARSPL